MKEKNIDVTFLWLKNSFRAVEMKKKKRLITFSAKNFGLFCHALKEFCQTFATTKVTLIVISVYYLLMINNYLLMIIDVNNVHSLYK